MFTLARFVVRNKLLALAVVGGGIFFMMPSGQEEEKPANPWSVQPDKPTLAQAEEGGFVDELVTEAGDFLDENGINPAAMADESVGRLDSAASAYDKANN